MSLSTIKQLNAGAKNGEIMTCQIKGYNNKTNRNNQAYQGLLLIDQQGSEEWANYFPKPNGVMFQPEDKNKWLNFYISANKGFLNAEIVTDVTQQAAQTPPQSAPRAAQAPNQPQGQQGSPLPAPQAPGGKDASICRQVAGKVAGRCVAAILQVQALQTGTTIENEIMEIAEPLANWFLTGLRSAPDASEIPDPDPRIQEEPPKEDEENIPF